MEVVMKENPSSTRHRQFKMRGQPSKSIWYNLTPILLRKMSKRKAIEISKAAEIPQNDPVSTAALTAKKCPYLSTVNRKVLDFDFERRCCVTLNYNHVYVCMVCGKFFQGRSKQSPAYTHAVEAGHCVFMNLETARVYCLPDGYEVKDTTLNDIQYALRPTFQEEDILNIPRSNTVCRDVHGKLYLPGYIGLNNLKRTDYINVIVQALVRVKPIRSFFLRGKEASYKKCDNPTVNSFGNLVRRIYNNRRLKNAVDPHEFVQCVSTESKKRFDIGSPKYAIDFCSWLLSVLDRKIYKKCSKNTVIRDTFQGQVAVKIRNKETNEVISTTTSPFFHLSLDLPKQETLLVEGKQGRHTQVSIQSLLLKYNASGNDGGQLRAQTISMKDGAVRLKSYHIISSPKYLILNVKRFSRNSFFVEKNNTLVQFPLKNLRFHGKTYDLIANIIHTIPDGIKNGEDDSGGHNIGYYKAHVQHEGEKKQWYEIEDLRVIDIMPQLVSLAEASILIYKET